jgi:hypothetical protein
MSSRDETPTVGEMLSELLDLLTGLGVLLLPLIILAVPCLVLLLPLALLAIPPALLALPYLLYRALRRRRGLALVLTGPGHQREEHHGTGSDRDRGDVLENVHAF